MTKNPNQGKNSLNRASLLLRRLSPTRVESPPEEPATKEVAPKPKKHPQRPPMPIAALFKPRTITLSIEGAAIRLLVTRGNWVESWSSVPFNARFLRSGVIADPYGLGQVFKAALSTRGLHRGRVVCALPGWPAISRIINLPKAAKTNLESVVNREARRVLAVSPEKSYLFWQLLQEIGTQFKVFVLAVTKDPLLVLLEALEAGGIRPRSMDLKPLALVRAINQRNAIIADGEMEGTNLIIVVDNAPVLMRSVFRGEDLLSPEDAASRLMEEVTRGIAFYNDTNKENPLDLTVPLYVTGELANTEGLVANLAALTGRAVPPLSSALRYPPDFPIAYYMANIGLALKKL